MVDSVHFKVLKRGIKSFNKWRDKNELLRPDLSEADLSEADLTLGNLSDSDLKKANLRGTNLTNANLSNANLEEADLRGANLRGTDLLNADLRGANLTGANFNGAYLANARLSGANLTWTNFTKAYLSDTNLEEADLSGTKLIGANLQSADLRGANLSDANLSEADFSKARLSGVNFNKSDLSKSILTKADLTGATINKSNFSNANLRMCELSYAKLTDSNFENALLDGAKLFSIEIDKSNFKDASISDLQDSSVGTKKHLINAGAVPEVNGYYDEDQQLSNLLEITQLKLEAAEQERKRLTSTSIPANPLWQNRNFDLDENLCFVIMPFKVENNLQEVFANHTKKIIENYGLNCFRADDIFKHEMIMEDIWEHICTARLLICDLTDKNPNVFYELGMAHTLGKRVVLIAQNDEDVPFDLRHLRYIKYEYTPPGMEKFEDELSKAIDSIMKATKK